MQYSVINFSPMLYFGSSDFIHFIAESLYPLYQLLLNISTNHENMENFWI